MIFKLLGFLDLVFGILLLFLNSFPKTVSIRISLLALMYFIIKFAMFFGDRATFGDFLVGLYFLFSSFFFSIPILSVISSIYLLQKAILTLIF
ncbi:MAG: hypothetical protein QXS41_00090 [Candidatus Woesearchaeota archaeon]